MSRIRRILFIFFFNFHFLCRRCALICAVEVTIQLGEDSTQLLPELIPFFSELLEDEDTEIQKICSNSIREIQTVTGEDLQKHL